MHNASEVFVSPIGKTHIGSALCTNMFYRLNNSIQQDLGYGRTYNLIYYQQSTLYLSEEGAGFEKTTVLYVRFGGSKSDGFRTDYTKSVYVVGNR